MGERSEKNRAAWTAFVEGRNSEPETKNKYSAERKNGYASKYEAARAAELQLLASRGIITDYREQERIVLVPGNGKLRPIVYVADFVYKDSQGVVHVQDSKGFKTAIYRLKKKMAQLLLGLEIEEI